MIVWPGIGARSNAPKAVRTTEGRLRSVATAGRSVKMVSPFRSRPTVMLNGRVEVATSMGLSRRPQRKANEPLNWTRWRTSNPARPVPQVDDSLARRSRRPGRRGRAGVKVKDVLLLAVPILVGKERLPRDVVDPDPDAAVEEELSLLDLLRRQRDVRRPLQVDVR